jgi:hypothetical protein
MRCFVGYGADNALPLPNAIVDDCGISRSKPQMPCP